MVCFGSNPLLGDGRSLHNALWYNTLWRAWNRAARARRRWSFRSRVMSRGRVGRCKGETVLIKVDSRLPAVLNIAGTARMARYRRDGPSIAICLFRFVLPPDVVVNMPWLPGNRSFRSRGRPKVGRKQGFGESSHCGKKRFPTVGRTSPRGRLRVPARAQTSAPRRHVRDLNMGEEARRRVQASALVRILTVQRRPGKVSPREQKDSVGISLNPGFLGGAVPDACGDLSFDKRGTPGEASPCPGSCVPSLFGRRWELARLVGTHLPSAASKTGGILARLGIRMGLRDNRAAVRATLSVAPWPAVQQQVLFQYGSQRRFYANLLVANRLRLHDTGG